MRRAEEYTVTGTGPIPGLPRVPGAHIEGAGVYIFFSAKAARFPVAADRLARVVCAGAHTTGICRQRALYQRCNTRYGASG